jgi:ankyrin repeat protein
MEHLVVVQLLIASHPDISSPKLLGTPLCSAATHGNIAAMQLLVQPGADVNANEGKPWSCGRPSEHHISRLPLCAAIF